MRFTVDNLTGGQILPEYLGFPLLTMMKDNYDVNDHDYQVRVLNSPHVVSKQRQKPLLV